MTEMTVNELLPSSPFRIGGRLGIDTGREVFVKLSDHDLLENNILDRSIQPMTIWSLVGPIGIGRTWTMAWLARQAREKGMNQDEARWEAALVPGLGGDGSIRSIFEGLFRSTEHLRDEAREEWLDDSEIELRTDQDAYKQILRNAIQDKGVWAVFTGDKGRFPKIRGIEEKPKWTDRETQIEFLILWLRVLKDLGIGNLIILIDEFEIVATRLGKSKLIDLSDGLRRFFDEIETEGEAVPNTQVILSLTTQGANRIDPAMGSDEVAGWVRPLQERMAPPFVFTKLGEDDAKRIAKRVLDVKRTEDVEGEYTPYTLDAIERAYEASDGLPRRFTKILNQMHQIGYKDTELDTDTAEEAISILGFDYEVEE